MSNEVYGVWIRVQRSEPKLEMLCASEGVADREVFAFTSEFNRGRRTLAPVSWTRVETKYTEFVRQFDGRILGEVMSCWETDETPIVRIYVTRMGVKQGEAIERLAEVFCDI